MKILAISFLMALAAACEKSGDDCIDESLINEDAVCTMQYDPVCGCNGETYGNECQAVNAGVTEYKKGPCGDEQ